MVTFKEFLILDAADALEEMAPKGPYHQDRVDRIMAEPDEMDNAPRQRRRGQRAGRNLRADGYKGDRRNAQEYPSEDEMEQKITSMNDRNRHYAKQFDDEVIQKHIPGDAKKSEPSGKRYNQRADRDRRRFYGNEEEMEAKLPAMRERSFASKRSTAKPFSGGKSNPSLKRQSQRADRNTKSSWGVGHEQGAKTL